MAFASISSLHGGNTNKSHASYLSCLPKFTQSPCLARGGQYGICSCADVMGNFTYQLEQAKRLTCCLIPQSRCCCEAQGSFQARGQIKATAASLHHSSQQCQT